jgi:hypothetical protein
MVLPKEKTPELAVADTAQPVNVVPLTVVVAEAIVVPRFAAPTNVPFVLTLLSPVIFCAGLHITRPGCAAVVRRVIASAEARDFLKKFIPLWRWAAVEEVVIDFSVKLRL